MIRITTLSSSGRTKTVHDIFLDPISPKTYASALLLNEYYHENDVDFITKIDAINKRIQFSRDYLTQKKLELGVLTCTYCPKTHLVIELEGMKVKHNIIATIDHIMPISKGGSIYDIKNVCVCCRECNSKKRDMFPEEFKAILLNKNKKN